MILEEIITRDKNIKIVGNCPLQWEPNVGHDVDFSLT